MSSSTGYRETYHFPRIIKALQEYLASNPVLPSHRDPSILEKPLFRDYDARAALYVVESRYAKENGLDDYFARNKTLIHQFSY